MCAVACGLGNGLGVASFPTETLSPIEPHGAASAQNGLEGMFPARTLHIKASASAKPEATRPNNRHAQDSALLGARTAGFVTPVSREASSVAKRPYHQPKIPEASAEDAARTAKTSSTRLMRGFLKKTYDPKDQSRAADHNGVAHDRFGDGSGVGEDLGEPHAAAEDDVVIDLAMCPDRHSEQRQGQRPVEVLHACLPLG